MLPCLNGPTLRSQADPGRSLRVLHLCAGNLYGGVEVVHRTLALYRAQYPDMEPHFAVCFEGRLTEELRAAGAPVHMLGPARFSRPWTVWRVRRALGRVLDRERPAVVVTPGCWQHALFAPVVRSRGLPLVFWSHDHQAGRGWQAWLARRTRPDLVLANSCFTAESVPNLFPDVPVAKLLNQIAAPPERERAAVRRQVRTTLQTPEESVVVVMACRLEPYKGHTLLLQALATLTDMPNWVCWIAGGVQRPQDEKYLAQLRRQEARAGLKGRVRWLGQRSDVADLLAAADLHCQPNIGPEPFGITFVEALWAGLPVVTTALGGAPEIVDETGGVLVPPGDATALAEGLRKLIDDPKWRDRLGKQGRARAQEFCDPGKMIHSLYHQLVSAVKVGATG